MNIIDNYKHVVFENYTTFTGRASRSEYWYFILATIILSIILSIFDQAFGLQLDKDNGLLESIYSILVLVPSIAVGVRRIHDSDKSGWWILLPFYNLYLLIRKGTDGENRFGPNPLGTTTETSDTIPEPTEAPVAAAAPAVAAETEAANSESVEEATVTEETTSETEISEEEKTTPTEENK